MTEAILTLIAMQDVEWQIMSEKAYETVKGYSWEDATSLFESALMREN